MRIGHKELFTWLIFAPSARKRADNVFSEVFHYMFNNRLSLSVGPGPGQPTDDENHVGYINYARI